MPVIKSYLFGVTPADPVTIVWATGILVATLLLAGYMPVARASRVDPLTALRYE